MDKIKRAVLDVYRDCGIEAFPLSCSSVLAHYHLNVYSYGQLKKKSTELYEICKKFSKDAFTYGNIIAYNQEMPRERIRFSLMHELGHLLLHTDKESEANCFASHVLAPRIILKCSGIIVPREVRKLFGISKEAASYALSDVLNGYESPTEDDWAIWSHFYRPEQQIHVYHISECPVCGSTIYNSLKNTCLQCKKLTRKSK